jgi:hypothetical protein
MLNQVSGQKVIRKLEVFFIFLNNFLKFANISFGSSPFSRCNFRHIALYYKLLHL